jgi:proline racemase
MNVADAASYSSVLLLNLSDNLLEQSRNNTVVVQQKEMDRAGVEPTTSASLAALLI